MKFSIFVAAFTLIAINSFAASFPKVGCWVNYNGMFGSQGSGFVYIHTSYDNVKEVDYLSPRNDMGIGFSPQTKQETWYCTPQKTDQQTLKVCAEDVKNSDCKFAIDTSNMKLYRTCNKGTAFENDGNGKQVYFETLGCTTDEAILSCAEQYSSDVVLKQPLNPKCKGVASKGLFRATGPSPQKKSQCLSEIDELISVCKTAGGAMGISDDPNLKTRQEARISKAKSEMGVSCKGLKASVDELIKVAVSVGKVEAINSDPALHDRQEKRISDKKAIMLKDYGL